MSDEAKLDMAIKYSTSDYIDKLNAAIKDWETVTKLIIEREKFIHELEGFEKYASDPNRFFVRGYRGSSAARLDEAVQRETLYNLIDDLEAKLEPILLNIHKMYKDVISYNGRPYLEKMKYDRLEMLHFLTEERRVKYFKSEARSKHLKTTIIDLKA
jgi:hypothetical protein